MKFLFYYVITTTKLQIVKCNLKLRIPDKTINPVIQMERPSMALPGIPETETQIRPILSQSSDGLVGVESSVSAVCQTTELTELPRLPFDWSSSIFLANTMPILSQKFRDEARALWAELVSFCFFVNHLVN